MSAAIAIPANNPCVARECMGSASLAAVSHACPGRYNHALAIQYLARARTVWTPPRTNRDNRQMMPPRPPPTVVKLSDNFGQYVLTLKCECGHTRTAQPQTLAALAGWDALLANVVKRLRCSCCGRRLCSVTVRPETKRDG
jgi:hypothetical protein